ncbi:hypothetical protein [Oryzicola mucosus]|uniref:Uncharacterized protein n=1 Tax=Oryzicola mucosus TaxID=2767425 RepID=A0A8J6PMC1_9HYPH|nr:hypothetical protein [Oryzicola mucosus]MBD0413865.1 hypothetical protein [Oryzicola mucosus]
MIVHYDPQVGLTLLEPDDFRNFKVQLAQGATQQPEVDGLRFVDDGNALVGIDAVPSLPGAPSTEAWREGYAKMLAAAAKYGWIDDEANAIKAHVERN